MTSASERRESLDAARPASSPPLSPDGSVFVWSDNDIERLRLAFKFRFDEPVPRTETLMCVAAEGMRILLERQLLAALEPRK